MAEREARGVDQTATRTIVDKILGFDQLDARLKPENNTGDGGLNEGMFDNP